MNPSTYTSVHSETTLWSYTSIGDYYDATQSHHPCTDSASNLYEDLSSSTNGWSGEPLALGEWSDADQALFEAFLTTDVTSTGPPGSCTVVPMQSSPSYDNPESALLHDLTEPDQLHALGGSQRYPFTTAPPQSIVFSPSEQLTAPCVSPHLPQDLIHPFFPSDYVPGGGCPAPSTSQSSRASRRAQSYYPYPSPSPEPAPQTPSTILPWQQRDVPATTSQFLHSQASGQPISWTATPCISPGLIYPPAHCEHDVGDHHSTYANSKRSRTSRRATRGSSSSSSSPYPSPSPTPSPGPSPRTLNSSIVIASQRRNAPARTAAPALAPTLAPTRTQTETWKCPYCPHVQRNRRSPDLKRHIKTHTRGADVADWVCCGVPVLNARELGVPAAGVREAQVFEFDGVAMLGGCRKAFSRRDALMRHLQREKGRCFGDAQSLHQRGNRESY